MQWYEILYNHDVLWITSFIVIARERENSQHVGFVMKEDN